MLPRPGRPAASFCLGAALALCAGASAQTSNYGVSVSSAGDFGTGFSHYSQISGDGRYIVFKSDSDDLVAGDSNGRNDIFRHDLQMGVTELVTLHRNGSGSANGHSASPHIDHDGRYCVFQSDASDLVPGDTNGIGDVFLRDMQTGVTERLSLTSFGAEADAPSDGPRISPNGQYVVFESGASLISGDTNGHKDVYRLSRSSGQLDLVSVTPLGRQGNDGSYHGSISDDGRYVAFATLADDLVSPDTNGYLELLVKDMTTGTLARLTVSAAGAEADGTSTWPTISGDGSTVTFNSRASNLVLGDTNGGWDIFAVTVVTGAIERVNVKPDGSQAALYTRSVMSVSTNGNLVAFASPATNLVPGDTNDWQDIFLRNRATGVTQRMSLGLAGAELNEHSWAPDMTPDGRFLTYTSDATNIVVGDTHGERQIFARTLDAAGSVGISYCLQNPNSTGLASVLRATGSSLLAQNSVRLEASQLPPFAAGYFLTSRNSGFSSVPISMGNICLAGHIGRFNGQAQIKTAGATGTFGLDIDLFAIPTPGGLYAAAVGETWYFQGWHRDSVNGVLTSNFTQGLAITFR